MFRLPPWEVGVNTLAWTLTFGIAVAVIASRWPHRPSRALGVLLLDLALLGLFFNLQTMDTDPAVVLVYLRGALATAIAGPVVVAYFILQWPRPRSRLRDRVLDTAVVVWSIGSIGAAALVADPWVDTMLVFAFLTWLVLGATAVLLLRDFARSPPGATKESAFLMGVGLGSVVLVDAVFGAVTFYPVGGAPTMFLTWALSVATIYAYGLAVFFYFRRWRALQVEATRARTRTFLLIPAPALVGALVAAVLHYAVSPTQGFLVWELVGALTCAGGLILFAFAALRYQVLGIELGAKWSLLRGSLLTGLAVVFFAAKETVEAFLPGEGPLAGVAGAAAVAAVAYPCWRGAKALADRILPGVHDDAAYHARRRLEVYAAALEEVLSDGVMTPKDTAVLATLRSQLGLDPEEALTLHGRLSIGARRA